MKPLNGRPMGKLKSVLATTFWILLGLSLLIAVLVSLQLVTGFLLGPVLGDWSQLIALLALVLLPWSRLSWSKNHTISATCNIAAAPDQIWGELPVRAHRVYHLPSLGQVEQLSPDRFRIHYAQDLAGTNALSLPPLDIRIIRAVEPSLLTYEVLNAADLPLWGKDHLRTEYRLTPTQDGTRVDLTETLACLRPASFLNGLFVNTSADGLKSLKARCEGVPGRSVSHRLSSGELAGSFRYALPLVAVILTVVVFFLISLAML